MRKTHHIEETLYTRVYSAEKSSMRGERDRSAGELAADLAFPVVSNLAAFDEFRGHRCDHHVPTMRALRRSRKTADSGELRPKVMKLHIMASCESSPRCPLGSDASWQRRDALMKLSWPDR